MHQNLNGLISKSDLLLVCLDELACEGKYIDILCITEHNMIKGDELSLVLSDFKLASSFMRKSRDGGSCILVRGSHRYSEIKEFINISIPNIFECSAIELLDHNTIIICIYRSPDNKNHILDTFFDKFNSILEKRKQKCKVIICGDFNIDVLQRNKQTNTFRNLIYSHDLKFEFEEATRLSSGKCIDNIIHNTNRSKSELRDFALSDHSAQILKFSIRKSCCFKIWYRIKRDFSKYNRSIFIKYIGQLSFLSTYESNDPNVAFNEFYDLFKLIYDLCFPLIRMKQCTQKRPRWISKGIKICSKRKRSLLWNYRKNPTRENATVLRAYTKRFKRIIMLTQKSQNDYYIRQSKNKSKATWNIINQNKTNFPKENIEEIHVDNKIITDPMLIANAFNDYFINVTKPDENMGNNYNNTSIKFNNLNTIFLTPTIPIDIYEIIMTLKNTNCTGFDQICTMVIKDVAHIISAVLSHVINIIIQKGEFPNKLKISLVRPLFKKNEKYLVSNYRPLALGSIFSKIIEKVINKQFYDFFESNDVFSQQQYGFRPNKSINLAIYDFLYKTMTEVDKRRPCIGLFMDMSLAFDRVDHSILLDKLYHYGIRGNAYQLIKSYLTDRQQITQIDRICVRTKTESKYYSDCRKVPRGVPQGSVLGPLLFLIYINDLPLITKHHVTLFADDSTILFKSDNIESTNSEIIHTLTLITNWLNNNKLKLNINKTKLINFKQRHKNNKKIDIPFLNQNISEIEVTKFLGLYIDNKLNWKSQIDYLCKRLRQFSYALFRLQKIVNLNTVLTAYHAYVNSTLRYGVMFWGNATEKEFIFKAQKRCIRSIFQLQQTDTCVPFFKKFKLLTLPCMYIFECAVFVHTHKDKFSFYTRARNNSTKIALAVCNTALMHKSVFRRAPEIYNNLPNSLKSASLKIFKKDLHKLLVEKCYYKLEDFLEDKL